MDVDYFFYKLMQLIFNIIFETEFLHYILIIAHVACTICFVICKNKTYVELVHMNCMCI